MIVTKEPRAWSCSKLAYKIYQKLEKKHIAVFSQTWFDINKGPVLMSRWLDQHPSNKIIYIAMFDPPLWMDELQSRFGIRLIPITSRDICFFLIAVDRFFLDYPIEYVTPKRFDYDFLCYQRKPSYNRNLIYNLLKDKNGIVTIGNKTFDHINHNIPHHPGLSESGGTKLEVANDIWSLGNINIWNQSFLNIVVETEQRYDVDYLFVSEKIFKPIIGLRPFICFGNANITKFIRSLGFETFDVEFGYELSIDPQKSIKSILHVVDNLDVNIFNSLMPKLMYNKNHLKVAADCEWKKIDQLIETIA